MTSAHRPTFEPAKGGMGRNEGDLATLSQQYSARDMPSHTKLKYRQGAQIHDDDVRSKDFRRSLEDREARGTKDRSARSTTTAIGAAPPKRPRLGDDEPRDEDATTATNEDPANADVDDPLDDPAGDDSDDSDGEDSEDEAALMAELAAIKKERQAERAEKEAREKADKERIRNDDLLVANPLLQDNASTNFSVKRRWTEDVVFKNCAKGTDIKTAPSFINDAIRTEFHRKFMDKYIK